MDKKQLLERNTLLRESLYREERSRFTQRREDLLRENKEMTAELASYGKTIVDGRVVPLQRKPPRQAKRPLRANRVDRKDSGRVWELLNELRTEATCATSRFNSILDRRFSELETLIEKKFPRPRR